jgi:hypothetical protein
MGTATESVPINNTTQMPTHESRVSIFQLNFSHSFINVNKKKYENNESFSFLTAT